VHVKREMDKKVNNKLKAIESDRFNTEIVSHRQRKRDGKKASEKGVKAKQQKQNAEQTK